MTESESHSTSTPDNSSERKPETSGITRLDADGDPEPYDELVSRLLEQEHVDSPALAHAVSDQEAPDVADALEELEEEDAADVLEHMEIQAAADALAEMDPSLAMGVVEDLVDEGNIDYAVKLVQRMASDDAADILQAVDRQHREKLLTGIPSAQAASLRRLIGYNPESAGGLMTTDYIALRDTMSVAQAIEVIRARPIPEGMQYLLVVTKAGELIGILGLRDLLINQPQTPIASVMDRSVDAVGPDMDREVVANQFDRYGYSMMPVVDDRNFVLGVVTVDDVIDIIREEQTEDVQRTVGAGAEEGVHTGFRVKLQGRLPWLLVNLLTSFVAASVVLHYSGLISQLAVLAALMPIIANQAGNAGQQSLAVTLRGIVLDHLRTQRISELIVRETMVGAVNGLIAGTVVGSCVVVFNLMIGGAQGHHAWVLGIVTVVSMSIALSAGCCAGCSIPLLMRRIGVDPAHGSTIFLTMITDTLSFFTFLTCSQLLWNFLIPETL